MIGDSSYTIFVQGQHGLKGNCGYSVTLRKSIETSIKYHWDFEDLWSQKCDTIEEARKVAVEYFEAHKGEYDQLGIFDCVAHDEEEPENTQSRATIICPYCGADNGRDDCEGHCPDEMTCDDCGKTFDVEMNVSVDYSTRKKSGDVQGIYRHFERVKEVV